MKIKRLWKMIRRIDPIWRIRKFFAWIKKSLEYAWFLRNDEDWDQSFIFELLKYKLKRQRDCIIKNDFIEGTGRIARQINYTLYLIDKVNGDYYNEGLRAMHELRWGKSKFAWSDAELPSGLKGRKSIMYYEKAATPEEQDKAWEEMKKILDFERMKWKEYNDRLWRHLGKYIFHWWD